MTFSGQITELGFEIINLHLSERLNELGYEFIKSKQVGFKKSTGDHIIEISFYKDFYNYVQGSFEEYEYPIIEVNGFVKAESKQINKWWSRHFKDEPKRKDIYRERLNACQFMAHFKKYEFIPDEWIIKNKENAELVIHDIVAREKEILNIESVKDVLTKENKSIEDYDIHLFLGQLDEAKKIMDELKISKDFGGLSSDQQLEFIDKREKLFLSRA